MIPPIRPASSCRNDTKYQKQKEAVEKLERHPDANELLNNMNQVTIDVNIIV